VDRFPYLNVGLGLVLIFVGLKMLMGDVYKIPIGISLAVVALILATSVVVSLVRPPSPRPKPSIPQPPLVTSGRKDS